jgi:hypothetical protein
LFNCVIFRFILFFPYITLSDDTWIIPGWKKFIFFWEAEGGMKQAIALLVMVTVGPLLASAGNIPQDGTAPGANVELVVRVFAGDHAVTGLSREKFRLSEDGQEREIRDFEERVRTLRPGTGDPAGSPPRCFAMVFTVFENSANLSAALDRLFADILRPQDQLFVFVNRAPLHFAEIGSGSDARAAIDKLLIEQAAAGRQAVDHFVQGFARDFDMRKFRRAMVDQADNNFRLGTWLTNYPAAWRNFRRRFLYPDPETLRGMAQSLAKIGAEKWVIAIRQLAIHPHLIMGRLEFRIIGNLANSIEEIAMDARGNNSDVSNMAINLRRNASIAESALNGLDDFPKEEMGRLLDQTGATWHAILLPVIRDKDEQSTELDLRGVTTGIEEAEREVVRRTGGTCCVSSDPAAAVQALAGAADVCYRMTYRAEAKKGGRVNVDIPGKRFSLVYNENPLLDPAAGIKPAQPAAILAASDLKIASMRFDKKKFFLEIGGFAFAQVGKKTLGRIAIHVSIDDNNSDARVFDQSKDLECKKAPVALALDFPQLREGAYTLTVEVRDLLTSQQTSDIQVIQVE